MADLGGSTLLVYFVFANAPDPGITQEVSPPFGHVDEARAYQSEYGGTVWCFPVSLGAGEIVTD
jgi:hypothetical protein